MVHIAVSTIQRIQVIYFMRAGTNLLHHFNLKIDCYRKKGTIAIVDWTSEPSSADGLTRYIIQTRDAVTQNEVTVEKMIYHQDTYYGWCYFSNNYRYAFGTSNDGIHGSMIPDNSVGDGNGASIMASRDPEKWNPYLYNLTHPVKLI